MARSGYVGPPSSKRWSAGSRVTADPPRVTVSLRMDCDEQCRGRGMERGSELPRMRGEMCLMKGLRVGRLAQMHERLASARLYNVSMALAVVVGNLVDSQPEKDFAVPP